MLEIKPLKKNKPMDNIVRLIIKQNNTISNKVNIRPLAQKDKLQKVEAKTTSNYNNLSVFEIY
jgi:hypothetical protein